MGRGDGDGEGETHVLLHVPWIAARRQVGSTARAQQSAGTSAAVALIRPLDSVDAVLSFAQ
jgi:hypothetical protein